MPVLHVKSPNRTTSSINLSEIIKPDTNQNISGIKTFLNRMNFTYGAIQYFTYGTSGDDGSDVYRQVIIAANNIDNWGAVGAKLTLHGYSNDIETCDGGISIIASDGTENASLDLNHDGYLKYGDCDLIYPIYTYRNFEGDPLEERFCVRYNNGIQICYGCIQCTLNNGTYGSVTFNQPFVGEDAGGLPRIYGTVVAVEDSGNYTVQIRDYSTTGATFLTTFVNGYGSYKYVSYLAIGFWKLRY